MTQSVLSIDISGRIGCLAVVEFSDRKVAVIEQLFFPTEPYLSVTQPSQMQVNDAASCEHPDRQTAISHRPFSELVASLKNKWEYSILTVSTPNYLTLNISLPFLNNKQIARILPSEVSDLVPFEVDEFALTHQIIKQNDDGLNEIHVAAIPRELVSKSLDLVRTANIEPIIITSPTSALAIIYELAPNFFSANATVAFFTNDYFYITFIIEGKALAERIIPRNEQGQTAEQREQRPRDRQSRYQPPSDPTTNETLKALTEINLSLRTIEQRYKCALSKVYLLSSSTVNVKTIQQTLGREIEEIDLTELIKYNDNESANLAYKEPQIAIASLAALFAREDDPPVPLVNFRVGQFAYSPQLKELFIGLKKLSPYAVAAIAALVLMTIGTLSCLAWYEDALKNAISRKIRNEIPTLQAPAGLELDALRGEVTRLSQNLKDLGSLSKFTAIDALLELSKDFPIPEGVTLRQANIKNNRVKIEGNASKYEATDIMEKKLSERSYIDRVKLTEGDSMSSGPGGRSFTIEIWLAE